MSRDYESGPIRTAAAEHDARVNLGKAAEARDQCATAGQSYGSSPCSEPFTLDNIDAAMRYQPWNDDQMRSGSEVCDALTFAAKVILRRVPDGPFRSVALREIINARMNANAAISFRGRF